MYRLLRRRALEAAISQSHGYKWYTRSGHLEHIHTPMCNVHDIKEAHVQRNTDERTKEPALEWHGMNMTTAYSYKDIQANSIFLSRKNLCAVFVCIPAMTSIIISSATPLLFEVKSVNAEHQNRTSPEPTGDRVNPSKIGIPLDYAVFGSF